MSVFSSYLPIIEDSIKHALSDFGEPGGAIRAPVEYALMSGGKRIRPLLVFIFANGIGKKRDIVDSALAVEFIHTSTLIADDLPCMDNDDERRGRPAVHKAFDEASALLASYALIPAAYSRIRQNAKKLKLQGHPSEEIDAAYDVIADVTDRNFGIGGILSGQYEDIFFRNNGPKHVQSIIKKKTSSLFEIACISGWLFGGGSLEYLPVISMFSEQFGLLFQIKDDLLDVEQDSQHTGLNYALLFGKDEAETLLQSSFQSCLSHIHLLKSHGLQYTSELESLVCTIYSTY